MTPVIAAIPTSTVVVLDELLSAPRAIVTPVDHDPAVVYLGRLAPF